MWKRLISVILIICMAISVMPNMAFAEENTEPVSEATSKTDDELWAYEEYNDGVVLTEYFGTATDVYVPSTVKIEETEYAVIKLGDSIFKNNDSLNSVTLGADIKEIGARAFYDADNLVCILTSEELTTIGNEAFYSCDNFNSIILYDAIESIGIDTFAECPELTVWCNEGTIGYKYVTNHNIPYELLTTLTTPVTYAQDGVTYYLMNGEAIAVDYDSELTSVIIPATVNGYSVTELRGTFKDCTQITEVVLPNTLKKIEQNAFENCTGLVEITIPDSVTKIGDCVFNLCTNLVKVNLSKNVKTIGTKAFADCLSLKEMHVPNTVTYVGPYAFISCILLEELSVPTKLTVIEPYSFYGCRKMDKIIIPEGVTSIGHSAFYGCIGATELSISTTVHTIDVYAFYQCCGLTEVVIPGNVTTIKKQAFLYCESLTRVVLKEGVKTIKQGAFSECDNLDSIVIPNSVSSIEIGLCSGNTVAVLQENSYAQDFFEEIGKFYVLGDENTFPKVYRKDKVIYCIENNEATAIGCENNYDILHATVQAEVNGYPVTKLHGTFSAAIELRTVTLPNTIKIIGKNTFERCWKISQIVLPESVTKIEDSAFESCLNLSVINIPQSVTSIGKAAFEGSNIKEITIPHGVETIKKSTFLKCDSLTKVTLPETIISIEEDAFSQCYALQEINMPNGITTIGPSAFYGCSLMNHVNMPEKLTRIEEYAFSGCDGITHVNFPSNLTYIGANAFSGCDYITSIEFSNDATVIDTYAFYSCDRLTNVNLPKNLTEIKSYTFAKCVGLLNITIPDSMTKIHDYAFAECGNLAELNMSNNINTIGSYAFSECNSLISVALPESLSSMNVSSFSKSTIYLVLENSYAHTFAKKNNLFYTIWDGINAPEIYSHNGVMYWITDGEAYAVDCDNTLTSVEIPSTVHGYPVVYIKQTFIDCSALVEITISEGVKAIEEQSFKNCTSLTKVVLPNSLTHIGKNAFEGCSALVEITIPNGVTQIGESVFLNCNSLETVNLSDNLTTISKGLFQSCTNLMNVSIPIGITQIEQDAFRSCTNLQVIIIPEGVTSIGKSAFRLCKGLTTVDLPSSLTLIDIEAFMQCESLVNIEIPPSVTNIKNYSFTLCTSLKEIVIPEGITKISPYSFQECRNLKKVVLPQSLQYIYAHAFQYCGFDEIIIPDSVKSIYEYAFYGCSSLKKIKLPNNLSGYIGTHLFTSCSSLEEIVIPEHITNLQTWTFAYTNIKTINLPNGFKGISDYFFYKCDELEQIVLPNSVTIICDKAFRDCPNLKKVTLSEGLKTIENQAFKNCTSMQTILIPESVTTIDADVFDSNILLLVYENSYAHTYAVNNNFLYFVVQKTDNPEILYGTNISGVASLSDGTPVANASVELIYADGTVKETVLTDENGVYEFTYAEVGQYTIRATDDLGYTSSQSVSVKRMNVFEVFLTGDTNLTLKKGWNVSGTVNKTNANITLTGEDGNAIQSIISEDGIFEFENVPNGTYILKAEADNGFITKEITIYNGDISGLELVISTNVATIWGYVEVADRNGKQERRNWVQVTVYNDEGNAVAQCKSDKEGNFEFKNLPLGEYAIVAETSEMRPDKKLGYDRSYTLTGYAYIDAAEEGTHQVDTIILYEENDSITTVSGKVTANGETQDCEVVLRNVFRYEVAKQTTSKNGKYAFKNVRDGLYFITATTKSDGMGYAVVVVRNGRVYGECNIKVLKNSKVKALEEAFHNDVPECNSREDVLQYRERIAQEKNNYDALSKKEKKQLSQDYINLLNQYCEWLANCEYTTSEGVTVEQGGLVVSGNELENESSVTFNLSVEKKTKHELSGEGIQNSEDYLQHSMEDAAQKQHNYGILEYYEIAMTKQEGDKEQTITSVYKDTDATGKFRITIDIPEEYRGYKNYSFIHVHKGEVVTLVDLDDNPNTVTFEVDAFSTFALLATDEDQTGQFVVGDLDNDSDFTELDIAIMRTYLTKKVKSFDFATSDINEDNAVDIRDVIALKRGIVEGTLVNGEEGSEGGDVEAPEEEW